MRIDKFLNICNLTKSRNIAIDMLENKTIFINSKASKKAYKVKINDKIKMVFLDKEINVEVLEIPTVNNIKKDEQDQYIKILK
jgi:ribosomal 50S subunit-recycling heat shock protein